MAERISYNNYIGVTLGNYRLEQLIEQGKLGPIFLARTSDAGMVQVRFLAAPAQLASEARIVYLGRFQQEANQVSALKHPNILPPLDYGNYQGMPYLVMPYLPLTSLYEQLKKSGPPDTLTVSRYFDQVAVALDYAHQQGILHRNLTTSNIFIQNNKVLLVGDFGVMRMLELSVSGGTRQAYTLFGSSEAITPEALRDMPLDVHTDIYALGSVLYRLLTGHRVYTGKTQEEIMQQILNAPVPLLKTWRGDLSGTLDAILAQAMAKDPLKRFQSAGELANAYHQVVAPNDKARPVLFVASPQPATRPREVTPAPATTSRSQGNVVGATSKGRPGTAGDASLSRRRFIIVAAAGAGVVVLAGVGFAGSRLLGNTAATTGSTPASSTSPQGTTVANTGGNVLARTADVPVNSAKSFTVPGSTNPGVLVHLPDNRFVAFDAVCTHAGCTVTYNAQDKLLECPCHGASFDPAQKAQVVQGPATTPLAPVNIKVNADGTITAA